MNVERWQRVKTAFAAAVDEAPERRGIVIDRLCAGDSALRHEVYSLIAAHESVSSANWPVGAMGASGSRPEADFAGNARFKVEARLGAGGFGVVYRARDRASGRPLALKVLRETDAVGMIRFKREFRMLADLSHPNLVRLFELFVEPDRVYFTMELVEGRPLVAALTSPSRPDEAQIGRVFTALAAGVGALHAEGVLHCDLKPSNVLLTDQGRVVVLDFGLATEMRAAAQGSTKSTEAENPRGACGTPVYMAPEQFLGRAASQASDWYGVGTMLFEALAGRLPFSGDVLALAEAKRSTAPVLPAESVAAFPVLAPLAEAMLAPDPEARPDGATIARLLAQVTGAAPLSSRPMRPTAPALFVGRDTELDVLRRAWARTRSAELAVVCVRGASGMGKTALVRRFLEELGDVAILAGRCHEREAVGYNAIDGVVDGLGQFVKTVPRAEAAAMAPAGLDDLVRVFPVLRTWPRASAGTTQSQADGEPQGGEGEVAELSPSPRPTDHRRRAFDALRDLLGAVSRRWPCVVFIDDLQWGDDDSAALLRHLLLPPEAPPLLVIAAFRGDESASRSFAAMLEALGASGRREDIVVEPLGADETRDLATRLLGEGRGAAVDTIVQDAGGVPFFVDTLVERFQETAGSVGMAGSVGGRVGSGQELRLLSVLSDRIEGLPGDARRLLEVVVLAGTPLGRRVAHQASGLVDGDEDASEHLLRARHLLRLCTDGVSLETYHDRIRDAVMTGLATEALPGLHRNIAQALGASGSADSEHLALHLAAAGERLAAAEHALTAARQRSRSLAFDRASELFRMAIDLKGPDHGDRGPLMLELADALAAAGRGAPAGDAYLEASERLPHQRRDAQFKGAAQYLRSGHIARGRALMRKVLGGLGWRVPTTTGGVLLAVVFRRAQLALRTLRFRKGWVSGPKTARNLLRLDASWILASSALMVDAVHATYYQTHNLLTALEEGEPVSFARALGLEAIHVSLRGARSSVRADRILGLLDEVTEVAQNPVMNGLALLAHGVVSANRGQWRSAREHSLAATKILGAHGGGITWELATARSFLLGALVSLGEFGEFSRIFPGFLEDSRARKDLYAESILVLSSGAYVVPIREDRSDEAEGMVEAALARLPPHGYQVPKAWAHFAKVDIALYDDDVEKAWRLERETWPRLSRSIPIFVQTLRIYLRHQRARAALAFAGRIAEGTDRRRLLRVVEAEAHALEREKLPWAHGLALGLRAGIAMTRGRQPAAATLLATAIVQLNQVEMGMHAATGQLVWGRLVGGSEGQQSIERAEAWMRGQGIARPDRVARTVYPGFDRA